MFDPISYKKTKDVDEKYAVKTAVIEKELNDFQNTIAGININQEAKQSVTGYGIVSLPKNCANGQVSATLRGATRTNLVKNSNFANGAIGWFPSNASLSVNNNIATITGNGTAKNPRFYTQGDASLEGSRKLYGAVTVRVINANCNKLSFYYSGLTYGNIVSKDSPVQNQWYRLSGINSNTFNRTPWQWYIAHEYVDAPTATDKVMEVKDVISIDLTATFGAGNEPDLATCDKMFATWFDGTKSTVSAVRVKSESADKKQTSMLYLNAGQPLRSLLNGTKDEVSAGKLTKRNKQYILQESDIEAIVTGDNSNTDLAYTKVFTDNKPWTPEIDKHVNVLNKDQITSGLERQSIENIGKYYTSNNQRIYFVLTKGTTLEQARQQLAGTTLIYQLATPVISDIQTSGSLFGYPSGTVYVENVLPVAGVYKSTGIAVTYPEFPIGSIEKISKIDPVTGVETEIPVANAVIAGDKLSFTHTSLVEGDVVFFTYYHNVESTVGETTIGYYDSRYTIKDSSNGKFYQWKITSTNGVASVTLVEV